MKESEKGKLLDFFKLPCNTTQKKTPSIDFVVVQQSDQS